MELIVKLDNYNGQYVVSSRMVAEQLGKRHDHVVRDLEKILVSPSIGIPQNIIIPSTYINKQNKQEYKQYLLTKDGFTLYMFNIQRYQEFKMAYIQKFNEMERALQEQQNALSVEDTLVLSVYKGGVEAVTAMKDLLDLNNIHFS